LFRTNQHTDATHALWLPPVRRERPRRRAAEQRIEIAARHSKTSLAVICMISETVRPSALAAD